MKIFFNKYLFSAFSLLILLLASCNNEKYLEPGEYLYNGASIEINSENKIPNQSQIKTELNELIYPEPNSTFLGARTKLWFYNTTKEQALEKIQTW